MLEDPRMVLRFMAAAASAGIRSSGGGEGAPRNRGH
jgi:hypothetical protein